MIKIGDNGSRNAACQQKDAVRLLTPQVGQHHVTCDGLLFSLYLHSDRVIGAICVCEARETPGKEGQFLRRIPAHGNISFSFKERQDEEEYFK
jgi:hypothetical protein